MLGDDIAPVLEGQMAASRRFRGMERVGGFGGKANQLNSYYKSAGTPDYFQKDLDRYRALTPAEIKAAVDKYLPKDRRVELSVIPGEKK